MNYFKHFYISLILVASAFGLASSQKFPIVLNDTEETVFSQVVQNNQNNPLRQNLIDHFQLQSSIDLVYGLINRSGNPWHFPLHNSAHLHCVLGSQISDKYLSMVKGGAEYLNLIKNSYTNKIQTSPKGNFNELPETTNLLKALPELIKYSIHGTIMSALIAFQRKKTINEWSWSINFAGLVHKPKLSYDPDLVKNSIYRDIPLAIEFLLKFSPDIQHILIIDASNNSENDNQKYIDQNEHLKNKVNVINITENDFNNNQYVHCLQNKVPNMPNFDIIIYKGATELLKTIK